MNIKISEDVIGFLNKKGKKSITLKVLTSGGGCCPTFEIPEVTTSIPENKGIFNHEYIDGIDVYIGKNVKILARFLTFSLSNTKFPKKIIPNGITYKKHE